MYQSHQALQYPAAWQRLLTPAQAAGLQGSSATRRVFALLALFLFFSLSVLADATATLRGRVLDDETGEPLPAVTVRVNPGARTVFTDDDGNFAVPQLGQRNYIVSFSYLGYKSVTLTVNAARTDTALVVRLRPLEESLGTATVTAKAQHNTENAIVTVQRNSLVVQNGVSAQQISKTQDRDASEVIRRVPGISVIDQKFVMVRGLSQRYNNVWINGGAVPSSEPDTRAFSFDLIPSSQVDNMQIVKSPAPQYPADFSGGFIEIETKDVPGQNAAHVSVGASANDRTHFRTFLSSKGSGTDFLGFDNGFRSFSGGDIHSTLAETAEGKGVSLTGNGFNNDWTVRRHKPWADANLAADVSHSFDFNGGAVLSVLGAINYSHSYKTYTPMENSLFGAYDLTNDCSVYLHRYTDSQYSENARLGAMLNVTLLPAKGVGRYEWKNIFNQLGTDRYTSRTGTDAQNNSIQEAEYYYSSRSTYNTQFSGKYVWDKSRLTFNAGYAYANRRLPDRRRYTLDDQLETGKIGLTVANEISREFTSLDEHIASAGVDYRITLGSGRVRPELLTGAYGEWRTRSYSTRSFVYAWDPADNTLPSGFRYSDLPTQLMRDANYGDKGLYLLDDTRMTNDYDGRNLVTAGYAAVNVPLGKFNVYAGVRYEFSRMRLIHNTRDYEKSPLGKNYDGSGFFPSLNATWKLADKHQLRLSYGRSVNRPEFREVSPSSFYDFDLGSFVQGNTQLKSCYVNNADIRYEWYPSSGDQVTLALFYKDFDSPIEWTYTVTGGTDLVYSYENARRAHSYGVELDVRKSLDFIGLKNFSLVFNGSLIKSRVNFADGSRQSDRPMQGQSPYLVNAGLFYDDGVWNASALFNRIGKRLIGVGRSLGSTADQTVNIPDSYEMPRNALDLSVSRKIGGFTVRAGVKDLLAEKVVFKQFNDISLSDGTTKEVQEVTRSYRPSRTFSLSVSYKF